MNMCPVSIAHFHNYLVQIIHHLLLISFNFDCPLLHLAQIVFEWENIGGKKMSLIVDIESGGGEGMNLVVAYNFHGDCYEF